MRFKKILNIIWVALLMLSGAVKVYDRGYESFKWDFIFNKFHPITWVLFFIAIFFAAFMGEKVTRLIPTKLEKFYEDKNNNGKLIWGNWWTVNKDLLYYYNVYLPHQEKLRNGK